MSCCGIKISSKNPLDKYNLLITKYTNKKNLPQPNLIKTEKVTIDKNLYDLQLHKYYLMIQTGKQFRIIDFKTVESKILFCPIFDRDFKDSEKLQIGISLQINTTYINEMIYNNEQAEKQKNNNKKNNQKNQKRTSILENMAQQIDIYINNNQFIKQIESQMAKYTNKCNFYQNYKTVEMLGKGASGTVFNIIHRQTKQQFAGKVINKAQVEEEDGQSTMLAVIQEIKLMKSMDSPYILQLQDVYEDEKYFYLVLDLFFGGGLDSVLERKKYLSIQDIRKTMKSLLQAVSDMNSVGIMHRDIKPANILLKKEDNFDEIVLCDFGLATKVEQFPYIFQNVGTPGYVAPEVFFAVSKYSEICDIYSCGILFYELLFNKMPWESESMEDIIEENKKGDIDLRPVKKLLDEQGLYKEFDLLEKMLKFSPQERINVDRALMHDMFSKENCKQPSMKEEIIDQPIKKESPTIKKDPINIPITQEPYDSQSEEGDEEESPKKFNQNNQLRQPKKSTIQIISENNALKKKERQSVISKVQRKTIFDKFQFVMADNKIPMKRPTVFQGRRALRPQLQTIIQENNQDDFQSIQSIDAEDDTNSKNRTREDSLLKIVQQHQNSPQVPAQKSKFQQGGIQEEKDSQSSSDNSESEENQIQNQNFKLDNDDNKQKQIDIKQENYTGEKQQDTEINTNNINKNSTKQDTATLDDSKKFSLEILSDDQECFQRNQIQNFQPVLKDRIKNDIRQNQNQINKI